MIRSTVAVRSIVLGIGLLGLALAIPLNRGQAGPDATSAERKPAVLRGDSDVVTRVGNDSCLARGCHGAVGPSDPTTGHFYFKGGEASTWRTFDPHARAYEVLLNSRSVKIGERLKVEMKGQKPHRAKLCLDCHSPGLDVKLEEERDHAAVAVGAGVDCEACHGNASRWLAPHVSATWPQSTDKTSSDLKASYGFKPILALEERAKLCVSCHVGDPTKQVNHDLIAAGHPRLLFELDSSLSALPRHWQEPHEKPNATVGPTDFHAKAWAVGQVVTTEALLDLLKMRSQAASQGTAPWPEFAEYDCFACHHNLATPSWRQAVPSGRTPGSLPWGSWNLSAVKALGQISSNAKVTDKPFPLDVLMAEMSQPTPDTSKVSRLADTASVWVKSLRDSGKLASMDVKRVESLILALRNPAAKPENWDEAVARMLGLVSLSKAQVDLGGQPIGQDLSREIESLKRSLQFPSGFDSPKVFQP